MKTKAVVLTLALCFIGGAMSFADSPQMGTWKLNESKSKLVKSMGKNHTVVYQSERRKVKVTVDGVDAKDKLIFRVDAVHRHFHFATFRLIDNGVVFPHRLDEL